jgi:hypothetical protein
MRSNRPDVCKHMQWIRREGRRAVSYASRMSCELVSRWVHGQPPGARSRRSCAPIRRGVHQRQAYNAHGAVYVALLWVHHELCIVRSNHQPGAIGHTAVDKPLSFVQRTSGGVGVPLSNSSRLV